MSNIFIELPTWIGDAVMTTPAIANIIKNNNARKEATKITLLAPEPILDLFKFHPNVVKFIVIDKSYHKLYKLAKSLDKFDVAISFRSSIRSWFFLLFLRANHSYQFRLTKDSVTHQVQLYYNFISKSLNISNENFFALRLYCLENNIKNNTNRPILGINAGAKYGSAKRWHTDGFIAVAKELSAQYDIKIFGSKDEIEIANKITKTLANSNIKITNLTGKTSVTQLINEIKKLDLFITGDSGPMHIAAAFLIPTVAIFGPTRDKQTSQWANVSSKIVKKDLSCQPCMQRVCPLGHHNCMQKISADEVLLAVNSLSNN